MFNSNFISIMLRFRDNDVFLQTGNDDMVLYPQGALYSDSNDIFRQAGFLVVFHRNFSSIIHRLRDNEVFMRIENDAINISPLWGATCAVFNDGL